MEIVPQEKGNIRREGSKPCWIRLLHKPPKSSQESAEIGMIWGVEKGRRSSFVDDKKCEHVNKHSVTTPYVSVKLILRLVDS